MVKIKVYFFIFSRCQVPTFTTLEEMSLTYCGEDCPVKKERLVRAYCQRKGYRLFAVIL